MVVDEIELFKIGVKPSLLIRWMDKQDNLPAYFKRLHKELGSYPYIDLKHRKSRLIFQSLEDCERFKEKMVRGVVCGVECMDYQQSDIGIALGYPPIAVAYVTSVKDGGQKDEPVARVNYYGLAFNCHPKDVDECITWYENNYGQGIQWEWRNLGLYPSIEHLRG